MQRDFAAVKGYAPYSFHVYIGVCRTVFNSMNIIFIGSAKWVNERAVATKSLGKSSSQALELRSGDKNIDTAKVLLTRALSVRCQ